jgi:uncharacterized damage-inducible protein DinB
MKASHLLLDTYTFMPPAQILSDLRDRDAMTRVDGAPHSVAEIVAHLVFWESWFLKRCRGEAEPMITQATLGWPVVGAGEWDELRGRFLQGLEEGAELGEADLARKLDPAIEFPAMAEYTVGDAIEHMAVHNAHHLGQVMLLRQMLGLWPPPAGSWTW